MSVHDRTALFEDLSRASTVPLQKPRSLSAASVPVIRISSEAENPPELPIRPSLGLRPQRTAPPAPRPKPTRFKSRPTVPPRLPSDDGVLSSRPVADGPPRIQLVDHEIELFDRGLSSPSRLEDQALFVEDGGSRATSPSNSSRQKSHRQSGWTHEACGRQCSGQGKEKVHGGSDCRRPHCFRSW